MNALIATEIAKWPADSKVWCINHPVRRLVVSVDSSGCKTFLNVYGTITFNADGSYEERLDTDQEHRAYSFYSKTRPDMEERAAEWVTLKMDRMFGHAKKRRFEEEVKALNPIDVYGFDDCLVCYERTVSKTKCRHPVCVPCASRLKKCPLKCQPIQCDCCCPDSDEEDSDEE
jgi:hypothetical protein